MLARRLASLPLAALLLAGNVRADSAVETSTPGPSPASNGSAATPTQQSGPLSLADAVELALARNHDVLMASLTALQSEQSYLSTRAAILPNLNFNASTGVNRSGSSDAQTSTLLGHVVQIPAQPASVYGNFGFGLTFSQLIFDGGAWWNNLEAAALSFHAQQETAQEQRLQTTYQVTQAFLELVRAQKQLAVLEDAARRSRDQTEFEEKLYAGGKAAQADVYASRSNRDNDELNRLSGTALVEQNRFALATLLGADPSTPLAIVEPSELKELPLPPPPAARAVELALSTRPSLRAYEHALAATRKTTTGLKGRYYPSLSAQAGYTRNSQNIGDIVAPPGEKSNLSATLVLNWNIFNGFADQSSIRRSELLAESNENDLMQGKRQVASDVNTAISNLAGARQRAQVAGQSEDTAREGLRLAKARQAVGVGTVLDVRDAELKLTQAQLAHVNALVDGREQLAALKRAMGADPQSLGTSAASGTNEISVPVRNIGG